MSNAHFRAGWENEHLATFLLSRIGFVSRPVTVADDVGTDVFCTLFKTVVEAGCTRLLPTNSIAVQVKSNSKPVDVTSKLTFFQHLEVPYYLGVIDRNELRLTIYTARFLTLFRSHRGWPGKVLLVPVQALKGDEYCKRASGDRFRVLCPHIATLDARAGAKSTADAVTSIHQDASEALRAIVSEHNHEYIFRLPSGHSSIFSGPESEKHFRRNFHERLAEVLHNLIFLRNQGRADAHEVEVYVEATRLLANRELVPGYLLRLAESLADRGASA